MDIKHSRREFLKSVGVGAAVSLAAGGCLTIGGETRSKCEKRSGKGLKLGLASYTCREFGLDETIAMTRRVGLEYICLKDFHLPMDSTPGKIALIAERVRGEGLKLYGGGVIYMKSEDQVNRAFEYARAAGMKTIVGVPGNELLGLVEKNVRWYNIQVAIHNHGPGDELYPTPESNRREKF